MALQMWEFLTYGIDEEDSKELVGIDWANAGDLFV